MNKILIFITTLFLFIVLGCNSKTINPKEHLEEIYSVTLNSIMEKDKGLDDDIEFLAIDMSNFDELNAQPLTVEEQEGIIGFFEENYKIEVMNASFEDLMEKGLYNSKTMVLNGVLLEIEKVDFVNDTEFLFEGSKTRVGNGAIGVKGIVHLIDGKWIIKDIKKND
ncbi:peptide ABC transporter substrate-binding protein [Aquibacillus rhizosphaerae]|uniref:Peptide ABC transporter substrate-binding protein n=1 Tax=Aquibacillus rhizosphaerae TaxID=3051431 RepID=A0ABT7L2P5_9BACI|nr:peptide ABC transporter substrate-binding protein [Aquibacillus sp. LR5S19]MDL4839450.1 peptide ABC transporter substrate-binding protein [Aquibacillus sp. LR5S19]